MALPDTVAPHSGRLPVRPDEVAISDALARELGQPSTISVFAGLKTLKVTGVYTPTFAHDAWQFVGGPGVWSGIPVEGIRRGFRLWDAGAARCQRVVDGWMDWRAASICSRRMSAWPEWRASSSIMRV